MASRQSLTTGWGGKTRAESAVVISLAGLIASNRKFDYIQG